MRQFRQQEEVDFVVIGSGAAGGIMAKQLSMGGFSVVVLEQGGWGKYGHERDYTKDELLNRNPSPEDRLISDPARQRNTFRRTTGKRPVRVGIRTDASSGAGPSRTGAAVGATCRGSSTKPAPWELSPEPAWRTGQSHTTSWSPTTRRQSGRWASRDSAWIPRLSRRCPWSTRCLRCR